MTRGVTSPVSSGRLSPPVYAIGGDPWRLPTPVRTDRSDARRIAAHRGRWREPAHHRGRINRRVARQPRGAAIVGELHVIGPEIGTRRGGPDGEQFDGQRSEWRCDGQRVGGRRHWRQQRCGRRQCTAWCAAIQRLAQREGAALAREGEALRNTGGGSRRNMRAPAGAEQCVRGRYRMAETSPAATRRDWLRALALSARPRAMRAGARPPKSATTWRAVR
jgi:hypothetical protein